MRTVIPLIRTICLLHVVLAMLCSLERNAYGVVQAKDASDVVEWIQTSAVPFEASTSNFGTLEQAFSTARIIGLGEPTHGQHEVFEIKRQLTMHLIRKHGIRLVSYEASASNMLKANEYVSGRSDDREQAMNGFGMLIWQIEENAALLEELREWNRSATSDDCVIAIRDLT